MLHEPIMSSFLTVARTLLHHCVLYSILLLFLLSLVVVASIFISWSTLNVRVMVSVRCAAEK